MKDYSYQISEKTCILCNSTHLSCLFKKKNYEFIRCKHCGIIYRFPQVAKTEYLKRIVEHYSAVDPSLEVAYSRRRLYERFLYRIKQTKGDASRLLDVGCGQGYFLSLAKGKEWNTYGIEIVPELVKMGIENYRLNIQCVDFQKSKFPESYFDVITLWNTFEELGNPLKSISEIKKILKPGGILFLRTPNATFHLFIYKIYKILEILHCLTIIPKQSFIFHYFNFSNQTLKLMLKENGFINIDVRNSLPTSGDPYDVKRGIRVFKILSFFMAQFIFILSWRKLTIAPSIEVFAENAKN